MQVYFDMNYTSRGKHRCYQDQCFGSLTDIADSNKFVVLNASLLSLRGIVSFLPLVLLSCQEKEKKNTQIDTDGVPSFKLRLGHP